MSGGHDSAAFVYEHRGQVFSCDALDEGGLRVENRHSLLVTEQNAPRVVNRDADRP
jgi:hypothetical protein